MPKAISVLLGILLVMLEGMVACGEAAIPTEEPDPSPTTASTAPIIADATSVSNRIAFTSYRDGSSREYIMNADGTGQTRLTVIAVGGEESQLRTGRRLHPPDDEPYRRGVRLGL